MSVDPCDVTACLVTRGDQPQMLERILDSLVFDDAVVWDNSKLPDWKCAGRYMAALILTDAPYVYFQDDDVVVPPHTQLGLAAAYESPVTANWGHGENADGYDDLPLVGGGAIVSRTSIVEPILRYAEHFPLDDGFKYEADFALGALYSSFKTVHLPFHIEMEVAQHPSRLCNQPWQRDLKLQITNQARWIRDNQEAKN